MMIALMGAGVVLTIAHRRRTVRTTLGLRFKTVFGKLLASGPADGSVTPFQALATALASTVGVGNIAGVSTAISVGGPGALFWLMVSGVLGMATKFAEIAISLHYRERDKKGVMRGGAMYVLAHGHGAALAGCDLRGLHGAGRVRHRQHGAGELGGRRGADQLRRRSDGDRSGAGGVTAVVVLGGVHRIVQVTEKLVPAMCAIYLTGALIIVLRFADEIPHALSLVLEGAFSGQAAVGGFAGATVAQAMRFGIARGLFSNEAGLGSAPLVHCSATTDHPVRQACYGIVEVFIDTIVVCLLTGMVILTTGAYATGETGAAMSAKAFEIGLPGVWGDLVVSTGLMLFAFSTVVGWSYYGETAVTYLFGTAASLPYRLLWIAFVYIGATGGLHVIWAISDTMNGLMALPNLVAVLGSLGLLRKLVGEFFGPGGRGRAVD